jgi:alanine racemase
MREAELGLNLAALHHNVRRVRELAPYSRILAMVKADAYGHGVFEVTKALAEVDGFGVAFIDEARVLREAGIAQTIAVLQGVFNGDEMFTAVRKGMQIVVHQEEQVQIVEACRLSGPIDVWLKVDTGMHRLGFSPENALRAYQRLKEARVVRDVGLMTHFACADELGSRQTEQQIARFRTLQQTLSGPEHNIVNDSLANSAGIVAWPAAHGAWVRPGIMLYGSSPLVDRDAKELGLRPVMTLTSRLIAINTVKQGDPVGYGAAWIAPRDTRIGVVAIGYGDGYPRHARSGTPVLINGKLVPVVGRVSMDMITVDLGDLPAQLGNTVVLWGEGLPADEVAEHAGTISYELFCKITHRVKRKLW